MEQSKFTPHPTPSHAPTHPLLYLGMQVCEGVSDWGDCSKEVMLCCKVGGREGGGRGGGGWERSWVCSSSGDCVEVSVRELGSPSSCVERENGPAWSHGDFPSPRCIMNCSKTVKRHKGPGDLPIPEIQFVKAREKRVQNQRSRAAINPQHVALSSRQFRYFNWQIHCIISP